MDGPESKDVPRLVGRLHRLAYGEVVAPLARLTGSLSLAEEAAQEGFLKALERWSSEGVPPEPLAWVRRVARNRAIDGLRRSARWRKIEPELGLSLEAEVAEPPDPDRIHDDLLRLLFTCCHPALAPEAQIALTLKLACGLTSDEIARAFVVSRATAQQRIVRAKRKIDLAKIPFQLPSRGDMPERLKSVIQAIYSVFTEGYASTQGEDLIRAELCEEAIRLARSLRAQLPERGEVAGLLALFLLHHARRKARVDASGRLIRLAEQDRSRWDRTLIQEALPLVEEALLSRPPSRFAIEAAIAALHARADRAEDTDWAQIAALYGELERRGMGNAVMELNQAVAVAMAGDLRGGLRRLDGLEASGRLAGYHLLYVARAELLLESGRREEAAEALRSARALATNPVERAFLEERLAEL